MTDFFGKDLKRVLCDQKFDAWRNRLTSSFQVDTLEIIDTLFTKSGQLLFAWLEVVVDGQPWRVLYRPESVSILVILTDENGKRWTVLTRQARIPVGLYLLEIPAGVSDSNGLFAGDAVRELYEETGLDLNKYNQAGVNPIGHLEFLGFYYPSPGGSSEVIHAYACNFQLPLSEIRELQGNLTGNKQEGEKIVLCIAPLSELTLLACTDGKALAAWGLYVRRHPDALLESGC